MTQLATFPDLSTGGLFLARPAHPARLTGRLQQLRRQLRILQVQRAAAHGLALPRF